MTDRHVVAMGGGGFLFGRDWEALDDYALALARSARPKVCYLPTASGDPGDDVVRFYEAFQRRECVPSHLRLFFRTVEDLREHLLDQDVVYVGGGNTANMLAVWRVHGVDTILREAWEAGVVMCGMSAGALCWFECGTTDSFGPDLAPLHDGLAILPGSFCPHYDGEVRRRPLFQRCVADGTLPAGLAADNGAAVHFVGTDLAEAVSVRAGPSAYRVERVDGTARETPLPTRALG
jgi:dipeptidase E